MSFLSKCSNCSASCTAEDDWMGLEAECPECGATVIIAKAAAKPSLTVRKSQPHGTEGAAKPAPAKPVASAAAAAPAEAQKACPNCQELISNAAAVICISCGTNLKTGKKISSGGADNSDSKGNLKTKCLDIFKKIPMLGGRAR
ncbi:MAG: hypothetical protein WC637_07580 [Victivallales bacterium]